MEFLKPVVNVRKVFFSDGSLSELYDLIIRYSGSNTCVFIVIDSYFQGGSIDSALNSLPATLIIKYIDSSVELKTSYINRLMEELRDEAVLEPNLLIAIGGGTTLDTGKAVSNLWTNRGKAEDYQGWDLVQLPGLYKVGVPTLPGTGAESSRTCVLTDLKTGKKMGMNSDYSVFDQLIIDPDLSATAPREQYFYTGMDTYIHCIESLSGEYRNAVADQYSNAAIDLCRRAFLLNSDMLSSESRQNMALASYFGGLAIGSSFVGLVHPLSAALSVVFGIPHCRANCIVMLAMEEFYPTYHEEFRNFLKRSGIKIDGKFLDLSVSGVFKELREATIIHEKPLKNALGIGCKDFLSIKRIESLFLKMEQELALQDN